MDLTNNQNGLLPAGVFDKLTALTRLDLYDNRLTALPAGIFDSLTALTFLDLQANLLTALPAGVFDSLTALTDLVLQHTLLTALPAGVFDGLTALTFLNLHNNSLTALPDDVFEPLTSLTYLALSNNPGAPFSPTAVALPDDGTVPPAGGTVMLDGSGSGGAWGTNVTYAWALTTPTTGVTVTFDNDSIAEPTVTIPQVTTGTDLVFTLTVTGGGGSDGEGISTGTDTATVTVNATVPGAPTDLTATASGTTTINLSWTAPASTGGSAITGYQIEVSPDGITNWIDLVANTNNATTTYAHAGLQAGITRYYRVSAINANTTGPVSNIAVATTGGATNLLLDFGTASDSSPIKVFESRDTLHRFTLTLRTARDAPADGNPQQPVTIPLLVTHMGGATTADYEGLPASVTFGVGESEAAFDMHAFQDQMTETGEGLRIDFGALPPGIVKGDWGPYETVEFVDGLVPIRATVDGATLVLTYDKVLSTASSPRASDFTVRVAAQVVTVDAVSVGGSPLVTLTLATAVQAGQTVTVDYRQGYDRIYDLEGNQADEFDDWVVTNTTGGGGGGPVTDTRPPLLTRATVNGDTLVLTYDETLDGASVPAPGAFAVTAAGSTVSANGVSVAGSAVTLTLANAVQANQTVTLDYTPGANPIQDAAGNDAAPLSGQAVTNNTPGGGGGGGTTDSGPTVTISTTASAPVTGPFTVTVVFSESVNGFELSDLVVGNGVASDLQGNGTTFTATITPAASGTVTVDIPDGAAADDAGNESEAASRFSIAAELDTTAPTVTISTAASAPVNGPFTVTFTFSEEVTGFELSDLVVGNGSSSPLQGDGASYTATITPDASGTVTVDVPAGAASDSAGNPSVAAQQFSIAAELAPTVTITGPATEPVIGPFSITVIFSEPVTGFELEDVVVGNGVASELEGDGARYTATVTPTAPGPVTVDIAAGAAEDSAGNPSTAADQFSITVELTPVPALPLAGVIALAALLLIGVIRRRAGSAPPPAPRSTARSRSPSPSRKR